MIRELFAFKKMLLFFSTAGKIHGCKKYDEIGEKYNFAQIGYKV